ncbi:hypothetical protein BH10PSE19_BH10PSE19_23110 [soil metagenome]
MLTGNNNVASAWPLPQRAIGSGPGFGPADDGVSSIVRCKDGRSRDVTTDQTRGKEVGAELSDDVANDSGDNAGEERGRKG